LSIDGCGSVSEAIIVLQDKQILKILPKNICMFEVNQIKYRVLCKGAQMFKMNRPRVRVSGFAGHFQNLETEANFSRRLSVCSAQSNSSGHTL